LVRDGHIAFVKETGDIVVTVAAPLAEQPRQTIATAREWDAIERHIGLAWSETERGRLLARFEARHRPHLGGYRILALVGHFEPIARRYFERHGYVCPFLEGGACSIYPVRPVACRMYGHFATRGRWQPRRGLYGCRLQADYHETRLRDGRPQLPDAEAVWRRARALTHEPRWRWHRRPRLLPAWIAVRLAEGARVTPAGSQAP
ncbi:MAG: hypothetical protein VKQ33_06875, partial [Candidatus Sericytochromatia bacterium]|nr:hypothetical protein [Candidatus Sericytochromatia bacterium]